MFPARRMFKLRVGTDKLDGIGFLVGGFLPIFVVIAYL